jgi:aldose 1-epimerase
MGAVAHAVSRTELDGLEAIELRCEESELSATFVPGAGMFGASLRHRGDQLLHVPGGARAYAQTGSTAGIPLLYPWANRLAGWSYSAAGREVQLAQGATGIRTEEHGLPIHGLLAASDGWVVSEAACDAEQCWLRAGIQFDQHPELLASFPYPHRLEMAVTLRGSELSITTAVEPSGAQAVPVSFGFHPYLRLPGLAREQWQISAAVGEHIELDAQMIPTGERARVDGISGALGERVFDDGYAALGAAPQFTLAGGGRAISVSLDAGYPFAQIFAPAASPFICFEPMTAPCNALVAGRELPLVEPGGRFEAVFSITITEETG